MAPAVAHSLRGSGFDTPCAVPRKWVVHIKNEFTLAPLIAGLTTKRTVGVLSRQQVCKCHLWPSTLPETTPLGGDESLHTFVFSLFFILLLSLLFKVDPPCSKGLYWLLMV